MREIIFRGKRESDGKWFVGNFTNVDNQVCMIHFGKRHYFVERESVGQYTGYNDATDTGVYEGDIVEFFTRVYDEEGYVMFEEIHIGYVRFSFGQWSVRIPKINTSTNLYGIDSRKIVVVGNIHDNPELVEGESQ